MKAVLICDLNCAKRMETRKSVIGLVTALDNTNIFFKNSEECDAKQHRGIINDAVSIRTRGEFCKYVA